MFKPMASIFTNHQIAGHYRAIDRAQKCIVPFHFEIQGREYPQPQPERNWLRRLSGTRSQKYAIVELTPHKVVLWSPEGFRPSGDHSTTLCGVNSPMAYF